MGRIEGVRASPMMMNLGFSTVRTGVPHTRVETPTGCSISSSPQKGAPTWRVETPYMRGTGAGWRTPHTRVETPLDVTPVAPAHSRPIQARTLPASTHVCRTGFGCPTREWRLLTPPGRPCTMSRLGLYRTVAGRIIRDDCIRGLCRIRTALLVWGYGQRAWRTQCQPP